MRLRRTASLVVPALLLPALVACGSTKVGYGDATTTGFEGVTISGAPGKAPEVKWKSGIAYPSKTVAKTLVKGSGAAVASGDSVSANIWIGDGTTKLQAYSDYANGQPETLTLSKLGEEWKTILKGAHYGDRIAAVVASDKLLGAAGNPEMGIGTKDSLLVIIDLVEKTTPEPSPSASPTTPAVPALKAPKGKTVAAPAWAPKPVLSGGPTSAPTGMSFQGVPKPKKNGPLKKAYLIKGTGATVQASDKITINYFGTLYNGKKPFDQSYTGAPLASQPLAGFVEGWKKGLVGVPVGSRVLLQVPPALGYGAQGKGSVPPNATMYFVVDVLGIG
ncbi:MAG: FKBP-type peptidyl-prolyl cis-trans isomerase [Nocardioides sp.]